MSGDAVNNSTNRASGVMSPPSETAWTALPNPSSETRVVDCHANAGEAKTSVLAIVRAHAAIERD
jgi:hypothetical protein